MQIIDLRAERGCNGQYLGPNRTSLRKTLRNRSRSYALAPHATASIAAQRTPPPSPICEFVRGGRERHRSVAGLRASFLHRHGMPPLITPAVPTNAPPMAPRTPRIDAPSLRGSASRASRSLCYHRVLRRIEGAHQTQRRESAQKRCPSIASSGTPWRIGCMRA